MSDIEITKQLSSSDIICPECIKTDDPELVAENEANAEDNEPPTNTKIIYISKTPHEHALHILKVHPECERVGWAKAQLKHEEEQEAKRIEDAKPKNIRYFVSW